MAVAYDILTLEISKEVVENVRIWGIENIKPTVDNFKKVYNLNQDDDYSFYITRQSKMNDHFIPLDKSSNKNGQKINSH